MTNHGTRTPQSGRSEATAGPFEFRCLACPWKSSGKVWKRVYGRAIRHCEGCGGPVVEVES